MTKKNALTPVGPHPHSHAQAAAETACCGSPACGSPAVAMAAADIPKGALLFRIPTMDCAVEESEIRRALEPVAGV
ncbi:MAG TPA: hypothetical protein VN280_00800, partial [Variovorax sp.]|nr:hypothetical protein [Variovorax sp.]